MNSFSLKLVAILTMLIDHMGFILFPDIIAFRIIGRIAFPIFAWLIANGYHHTKDVKKYLLRLGIFAIITEPLFDYGFRGTLYYPTHQNVLFTLLIGLYAIYLFDNLRKSNITLGYIMVFVCSFIAEFLHADYGSYGVFMIFVFYLFYDNKVYTLVGFIILNIIRSIGIFLEYDIILISSLQLFSVLSLIFILLYNKKRGPKIKYFFYVFYPVHVIILRLIASLKS